MNAYARFGAVRGRANAIKARGEREGRDAGAPRGVGPRCESTEIRHERERGILGGGIRVMLMSENKSKNKKRQVGRTGG